MTLILYPAANASAGSSTLYEDAGDGFGYGGGGYARRSVLCGTDEEQVIVTLSERDGTFVPERGRVVLELRGVDSPSSVTVNGADTGWTYDEAEVSLVIPLEEDAGATTVEVTR